MTTEWDIRLRADSTEADTILRVQLGYAPSLSGPCLVVEGRTEGSAGVSELTQTADCVALPEAPSLLAGLIVLAVVARGRHR